MVSVSPPDSVDSRNFPDSIKVLKDCCEQGTICRFELTHNAFSTSMTMVRLHPQGLELRMSAEDDQVRLLAQAICCISFSIGPSFCAFLGHLVDVRSSNDSERLVVVTVPKQLTATNLRHSFRVPVVQNSGLETIIRIPHGERLSVQTVDVAEAGLEIEFEKGVPSSLAVGTIVDVEMRFCGDVVQKKGEVRRIEGLKYGIAFNNDADDQCHRQDARLNGFVLALQQMWLKSRLR